MYVQSFLIFFQSFRFVGNYGVSGLLGRLHGTDEAFRKSVQFQLDKVIFSPEEMVR